MKKIILFTILFSLGVAAQNRKIELDTLVDNHSKAQLATSLEISRLTGVTAAIQSQLDSKATLSAVTGKVNKAGDTMTGGLTVPSLNTITSTEISYLAGVTGNIQTQLNSVSAIGSVSASTVINNSGILGANVKLALNQLGFESATRVPQLASMGSASVVHGAASAITDSQCSGNTCYVIARTTGYIESFDISDRRNPVYVAQTPLTNLPSNNGPNNLVISGNYLFTGTNAGYLSIFNIDPSNPATLSNAGQIAVSGCGQLYHVEVAVNGDTVYGACQNTGLTIFDVTNKNSPAVVYSEGGGVKSAGVAIIDSTHVVTTQYVASVFAIRQMKIWDVTTPASPTLLLNYTLPSGAKPLSVVVNNGNAFVGDQNNGGVIYIYALGASPYTSPVLSSTFIANSAGGIYRPFTVDSAGNYLYACATSVQVFDVTNKILPSLLTTTVPSTNLTSCALTGDQVMISDRTSDSLLIYGSVPLYNTFGSVTASTLNLTSVTALSVPVFDSLKKLVSSSTTLTELGYLSGVTSALQTQLDAKASLASVTGKVNLSGDTMSGGLTVPSLNTIPAATIAFLSGTSANIQTQINSLSSVTAANRSLSNLTNPVAVNLNFVPGSIGFDNGSSSIPWNSVFVNGGNSTTSGLVLRNQGTGIEVLRLSGNFSSPSLKAMAGINHLSLAANTAYTGIMTSDAGITTKGIVIETGNSSATAFAPTGEINIQTGSASGAASKDSGNITLRTGTATGVRGGIILDADSITFNLTGVTANRAVITDASQKFTTSLTTSTEIGFLSGTTAGVQAQINGVSSQLAGISATGSANSSAIAALQGTTAATAANIAALQGVTGSFLVRAGDTMSGNLGLAGSSVNVNTVLFADASRIISSSTVTPTELGYLSGTTASVQTQINTLNPASALQKAGDTMTGNLGLAGSSVNVNTVLTVNANRVVTSSSVTPTELGYLSGITTALAPNLNGLTANVQTQLSGGGSVRSDSSVAERVERATTTLCTSSPCTISSQSGAWLTSITRSAAGNYTANFAGSIWSSAPTCVCTTAGGPYTCVPNSQTTSTMNIQIFNNLFVNADGIINLICMGPR